MLSASFLHFIAFASTGFSILASLIGLVRYRWLPSSLRWLAWLACFEAVMNIVSSIVAQVLHIQNLFLLPFILIGDLVLLSLAYRQALQWAAFSRALPWLLSLFSVYALLESVPQLNQMRHVVPLELISCLCQLGLVSLYFRKLLNELHTARVSHDPFFWLSVALVLNGLGTLLISLFSNYILAHCSLPVQQVLLWGLLNVFNILLYLACCRALWMRPPAVSERQQLPRYS